MTALSSFSLDPVSINKLVDEIDDNSFYHHPSRPQRWSHPEFAADDFSRTWVHAPWFQNTKRRARRFSFPAVPSKFPWGYVIYRTVYTAESDRLWPIAMDKLSQIINYAIDCQFYKDIRNKEPEDPEPEYTAGLLVKESRRDVFSLISSGVELEESRFASILPTIFVLVKVTAMVDFEDVSGLTRNHSSQSLLATFPAPGLGRGAPACLEELQALLK